MGPVVTTIPRFHHTCPGGCGAAVPKHLFACKPCWFRLPAEMRRPIIDNFRRDDLAHIRAMGDAFDWYADNPRTAP